LGILKSIWLPVDPYSVDRWAERQARAHHNQHTLSER
jgi:hypothetical protein